MEKKNLLILYLGLIFIMIKKLVLNILLLGAIVGFMSATGRANSESLDECTLFWEKVSYEDLLNAPVRYLDAWRKLERQCDKGDGYFERQLGYIHLAERNFLDSERAFINSANKNNIYLNDLAQLYLTQSQYSEDRKVQVELISKAQNILLGMVKDNNVNHAIFFSLGFTFFLQENFSDAIVYFNQSLNMQTTSKAYSLLGQAYFNERNYEGAVGSILKAFDLDKRVSEDENSMLVLAMSHVALKDFENAKITLSLLSKTRPDLVNTDVYQSVFNAIVSGFIKPES
ncbi:tetratricopeptide repeat protein [Vibrio mimicus]|uniref:Tetratricopeptide repeat protein n=2 Tax=Vibrio mimicus TaxID=674 RepID=A0A2J9VJA4_VIBMI|nr:tetratricopeptide repeat protein [Vibrio mimicus]